MKSFYAVILAGGGGTRFWPLSRRHRPKQTLSLLGSDPMVRCTVDRLSPLFAPEDIYVITGRDHAGLVREQLPMLPPGNVVDEPEGRDTAAAVGLAAVLLRARDPEAVFAMLPADHHIGSRERFHGALTRAREAARTGALVTFGVKPRFPSTGYGYLKRGAKDGATSKVERFTEKPSLETAKAFVASGDYFWNSGIFVWQAKTILEAIGKHLPGLGGNLREIAKAVGTDRFEKTFAEEYAKIDKVSIDFGVMEKSDYVLMVEADFDWDDVGSWGAAAARRAKDADGNTFEGRCVAVETKDSLMISDDPDHLVAGLGLEGWVVVHTREATLVCPKDRSEELKKLIGAIRDKGAGKYL